MASFRALLTTRSDDATSTALVDLDDDQLMPGDVDVAVEYSGINYKDALAVTGGGAIMRTFPLIPGIDLAGTVTASRDDRFRPGDAVLATGYELSHTHHGGLAERARVPADWLVPVPAPLGTRDAMVIGTAGFTAMLSVLALERGGVVPAAGDVVVTGAGGGVGSVAVALLSGLGYQVVASTGRAEEADRLRALGAAEVIDRATLSEPGRGFVSTRWAGGVDAVGSHTLANVLAATGRDGVVAACGLVQGPDLPGSVLPFILRGVTLAGIDSVGVGHDVRVEAWGRLARDLDLDRLADSTSEVGLSSVLDVAARMLEGRVRGRTVVDLTA